VLQEVTMSLDLSKPFESYVSIEAFPSSGDVRRYVLHLRYELEGTWESGEITWPWELQAQQGGAGHVVAASYAARLVEEMENFRRHVEYELQLQERRVYERTGSDALVLAARQKLDTAGDSAAAV
jgi:hypothetical protein